MNTVDLENEIRSLHLRAHTRTHAHTFRAASRALRPAAPGPFIHTVAASPAVPLACHPPAHKSLRRVNSSQTSATNAFSLDPSCILPCPHLPAHESLCPPAHTRPPRRSFSKAETKAILRYATACPPPSLACSSKPQFLIEQIALLLACPLQLPSWLYALLSRV